MRIKLRTAGTGQNALTRFPSLPCKIKDLCADNGKIDFAKASAALSADSEYIQSSAKDDLATVALAIEFLSQLRSVVRNLTEDDERDLRGAPETTADRQNEKRMDKGQFCIVRIDINRRHADNLVRISVGNPREVKGSAPARAYDIAVMCARIFQYLKAEMDAHNCRPIVLAGGEGAGRVFDDATAMGVYDSHMKRWDKCPRRRHDTYCSPSDFACPCYRAGKCIRPVNPLN